MSSLAYICKQYTCSDNPTVCLDRIEHQPCTACSGAPHDDESSDYIVSFTCASAWTINKPHHPKEQPRCYAKLPTVQDAVRSIPGLISCTGVTGRLLFHAPNAVRLVTLFTRWVEASPSFWAVVLRAAVFCSCTHMHMFTHQHVMIAVAHVDFRRTTGRRDAMDKASHLGLPFSWRCGSLVAHISVFVMAITLILFCKPLIILT